LAPLAPWPPHRYLSKLGGLARPSSPAGAAEIPQHQESGLSAVTIVPELTWWDSVPCPPWAALSEGPVGHTSQGCPWVGNRHDVCVVWVCGGTQRGAPVEPAPQTLLGTVAQITTWHPSDHLVLLSRCELQDLANGEKIAFREETLWPNHMTTGPHASRHLCMVHRPGVCQTCHSRLPSQPQPSGSGPY
jgi:hypothetical protein